MSDRIQTHIKGDEEALGVVSIQTVTYDGNLTNEGKGDADELGRIVVRGDAEPADVARALSKAFATVSERYEELAKHYDEESQ